MRIISTVPSQTELLADLGLQAEVIGITKFCIHPQSWFKTKTRIGGTKTLNLELIKQLQPDLIIANKEENVKEQITALGRHCEVFVSDVKTTTDNLKLIPTLGQLTGTRMTAIRLAQKLSAALESIQQVHSKTAAYLIWKDPYMTVGHDTYIHDMLNKCGLRNVFHYQTRYPTTTINALKDKAPELILLSSEPYPFKQEHLQELQSMLPESHIVLVDGEIFSWYGTRLSKKLDELNLLLNTLT